jgi:hypothetical protein
MMKERILSQLHFTTLPNRTGKAVPKALSHMALLHPELMQDEPYGGLEHRVYEDEEEDTEYSPPERFLTSAKPCELSPLIQPPTLAFS